MNYKEALNEIYRIKQNKDTVLSLRDCGLLELPSEIKELQDIELLNLCGNKLRTLPKEIGELKNLKILYVDNNCLEFLPKEIGDLNLMWLTLSGNDLKKFPEIILYKLFVNGLLRIDLGNNPISNIPKEFLHEEPREHGVNLKLMINYFVHNRTLIEQNNNLMEEVQKSESIIDLVRKAMDHETSEILDLKQRLISILLELQGRIKMFETNANENKYTDFLVSLFNIGGTKFFAKDQSRWGESATGKSPGSIDIKFFIRESTHSEKLISLCECFKLNCFDSNNIKNHVSKLFNYDANGLNENFIIVYYTSNSFEKTWTEYISYISELDYKYPLVNKFTEIDSNYSDIKVGFTKHNRHEMITKLYHIFVNLKV
jgi:hypothetical protein